MILIPEKSQVLEYYRYIGARKTIYVSQSQKERFELECFAWVDYYILGKLNDQPHLK